MNRGGQIHQSVRPFFFSASGFNHNGSMKTHIPRLLSIIAAALLLPGVAAAADTFEVAIEVSAGRAGEEVTPIWRFFGADEPNYATMKDGRQLLGELGMLRKDDVYFRAHNLLSSGDGTPALKWGSTNVYTEDAAGNPRYDWRIVDGIFDAYLANGVRPFVQLGFMPQALSTAPASVPYKHSWRPGFDYNLISGGWGYPPRDYDRWSELVFRAHPASGAALRRSGSAALVVRNLERAEWAGLLESVP